MKYKTKKEWLEAAKFRVNQSCEGIGGFVWQVIILGLWSLWCYVREIINAFFRREPVAGIIFGLFLFAAMIMLLFTFSEGRATKVTLERRVDSLNYELSKYAPVNNNNGYETVAIDRDTITYKYLDNEK